MTKYSLNIHHRDAKIVKDKTDNYQIDKSPVGHFYISLQEENKEPIFFGKYPRGDSWLNNLFGSGKIISDDEQRMHERLIEADKKIDIKHVYTKTITLNESEYKKALNFAKASANGNIGDNFYFLGASDCRDFVQDVWISTGKSLPFTVIFSTDEIKKLNTAAAYNLLSRFGSRDIIEHQSLIVENISKENIARKFNLALDSIHEIDALNNPPTHLAFYEGIQLTKYFKVIVNPEVINNALVGVSKININNTIDSVTTAASDTINIHNDTTPQVSTEMQELIRSFKLPNITGAYHVGYKGINTHQMPINRGNIEDLSTMNETVRWILNIHHSTNKGNIDNLSSANTNVKDGVFYISIVSPEKTTFYGNDVAENNNKTTKDINTKSIALSWFQYHTAVEWANRHSRIIEKDSNVASIGDKDGRNFVQDLWHALEKPLYFTIVYTTEELLKLGTKCATDLLSVYGSFDTMKHGQFIDKDLSNELLADRLNIDVNSIVGGGIGIYDDATALKSFAINVDQKLVDQVRAMVISSFDTPEQCRIVTKHNSSTVQSLESLKSLTRNKNTEVIKLVGSLLQQYQWNFNDNILEFTTCRNNKQELKDEYNQHQPSMFYARRELVQNSFNHSSLAKNISFDQYILHGYGEPLNIHMWYANKILACSFSTSILGYNINDKAYDGSILVNNIIQHWNNKLDLLSTKSELNISLIPSYDYRTYNLIIDTIYETLSPLGFKKCGSSMGPDKSAQAYYELECASINSADVPNYKHRHHHGEMDLNGSKHLDIGMHHRYRDDTDHMMFSSASSTKPVGYNILNVVKEQIGKIQDLTFSNFIESVSRWYKSDHHKISEKKIVMKDSNIVSDTVSNLDDLIMDTSIFNDHEVFVLRHVPLLPNESTTNLVITNDALNINGTLMLANLVVRMMTPIKQTTTVNDIRDPHETTVNNNVVDYGHAHILAYSSYVPDIYENAEDIELLGAN